MVAQAAEAPPLKEGHGWPCKPTPGALMSERTLRVQGRMQGGASLVATCSSREESAALAQT